MTLAAAALLTAILGVVLAGASLTWQVVTFVMSGHRVSCSMSVGYVEPRENARAIGAQVALTAEHWSSRDDLRSTPVQHFFVSVVNRGRSGVWIDSVGFSTKDDRPAISVHSAAHDMTAMPTFLEAGQTKVLQVPMSLVLMIVRIESFGASDTDCVHAVVSLGSGTKIRTKQGVRVALMKDAVERSEAVDGDRG